MKLFCLTSRCITKQIKDKRQNKEQDESPNSDYQK